jgi:hypothetical protein
LKRILLLVLMFISFITPCAFATDGNVYENQQYKFRITLPDNWNIHNTDNSIFEASLTDNIPLFSMINMRLKIPPTNFTFTPELKDKAVTQVINNTLKSHPNMVVKEKRHVSIANDYAIRVVSIEDFTYIIHYFIFGKDYILVGLAGGFLYDLDADQKLFDQIISTFTFID